MIQNILLFFFITQIYSISCTSTIYYNDQNDRIATWISQYKNENGVDALQNLDREEYNKVIENFIYESNLIGEFISKLL